jgi:hypothetical protein
VVGAGWLVVDGMVTWCAGLGWTGMDWDGLGWTRVGWFALLCLAVIQRAAVVMGNGRWVMGNG